MMILPRRFIQYDRKIKNLKEIQNILNRLGPLSRLGSYPLHNFRALLKDCDISIEDINGLNIIHVAGTKGKGSTCAFTESILRHHGYKTGFYSSPHIQDICERIRINGQPISIGRFYSNLRNNFNSIKTPLLLKGTDYLNSHTPRAILLSIAFKVFLEEKVDVAILETVLGGTFDETNICDKPVVCGITQIDLDHCNVLGNTIQEISNQKAGIIKTNIPVFIQKQDKNTIDIFKEIASRKSSPISIVPSLSTNNKNAHLGLQGDFQKSNAALAIALSKYWVHAEENIKNKNIQTSNIDIPVTDYIQKCDLTDSTVKGLASCEWLCRAQVIRKEKSTYFLDGAHTPISCQHCFQWYREATAKEKALDPSNVQIKQYILFSAKRFKNCLENYKPFNRLPLDKIILTTDEKVSKEQYIESKNNIAPLLSSLKETHKETDTDVLYFPSIQEAYQYIEDDRQKRTCHAHILVTGSLALCANIFNKLEGS